MSSFPKFCLRLTLLIFQHEINKLSRTACTAMGLWPHSPNPSWSPLEFGAIWWWLSTSSLHFWWEKYRVCKWTGIQWFQEIPSWTAPVLLARFGSIELGDHWASRIPTPPPLWVLCYISPHCVLFHSPISEDKNLILPPSAPLVSRVVDESKSSTL